MMIREQEIIQAAMTLLIRLEVISLSDVQQAGKNGLEGVYELLNNTYNELYLAGIITLD